MSLHELLQSIPISDLIRAQLSRGIVTVDVDDTAATVLHTLVEHNLYSCPVTENGKVLGLVDMTDMLYLLVGSVPENLPRGDPQKRALANSMIEEVGREFFKKNARELMNASGRNPYEPLTLQHTMFDVAKALSRHLKRAPVIDAEGNVIAILSRSALIKFLSVHIENPAMQERLQQTLEASKLGMRKVVSVNQNDLAIESFRTMLKAGVSSAAVMENGKLIGNISVKDLKGIEMASQLRRVLLSTEEYVNTIRRRYSLKAMFPAVYAAPESTVERVILRLAATGVHRMYICSDHTGHGLCGVVSLSDIALFVLA